MNKVMYVMQKEKEKLAKEKKLKEEKEKEKRLKEKKLKEEKEKKERKQRLAQEEEERIRSGPKELIFWKNCERGNITRVRNELERSDLDLNFRNMAPGVVLNTGLLVAAAKGYYPIVDYLLRVPASRLLDVNLVDFTGRTPLMVAIQAQYSRIAKRFLLDERVNVNLEDPFGQTALWMACRLGLEDVVKPMIARGGLDVTKRSKAQEWNQMSAADVARKRNLLQIATLIDEYQQSPVLVSQRVRKEIGWTTPQGSIFALVVFLSESFLEISDQEIPQRVNELEVLVQPEAQNAAGDAKTEGSNEDEDEDEDENEDEDDTNFGQTDEEIKATSSARKTEEISRGNHIKRFFKIASQLHFDLQMVLINRAKGSAKNSIPGTDREVAVKNLFKSLDSFK